MKGNGIPPAGPIGLEPGARFTTRGRTITEADLVSFSALTGDWHPQHADAAWAKTSRFGERVAHGMLVLSYAIGLIGFDPERVVALRGVESAVFKRPVKIGDTIRVEGAVESLRPLDDETGLLDVIARIVDQNGALVARAKLVAVHRLAPEASTAPTDDGSIFSELFL